MYIKDDENGIKSLKLLIMDYPGFWYACNDESLLELIK